MVACCTSSNGPSVEERIPACVGIRFPEPVALLTGGFDKPYTFGLAMALASQGIKLEVVGSDDVDCPEFHTTAGIDFLNLRGAKEEGAKISEKASRVLRYYARLLHYALVAKPRIFHILWNNKFEHWDRTLLMLYYRVLGKKIVFTAHNVNAGKRDAADSLLNRLTLRIQYSFCDHIFVHTEKMKLELMREFRVAESAVSVIPFGINNSVPDTDLTAAEAKLQLGIQTSEKTILFFGAIRPYKGLEYLVGAFQRLQSGDRQYRLIIAGEPKNDSEQYFEAIRRRISDQRNAEGIILRIQYIPDEETELYFKAADVLALPYTHVFQSGVLFLAYSFGLPVVASDVGSVSEDLIKGRTGFVCRPCDAEDLSRALKEYFESDLFKTLEQRRHQIKDFANARHSWNIVAEITRTRYLDLMKGRT